MFEQGSYTLMQCDMCDLFFIHPYPTDVGRHHQAVSDYSHKDLEILDRARHYENEKFFYARYFGLIQRECQNAGAILDVGCGCGHLLERLASQDGLYRAGIELNHGRAQFARKTARCEIFEAPIEEFNGTRRFDVITLINVFSHVPDIDRLFTKLRLLLAEGGKIILRTGEMKRGVKKSAIFDWEFPDHLQFLGWRTMEYLAARYGFQVRMHLRVPLSRERFAASTWKMKGRSAIRNAIKGGVARVPFALPLLGYCYEAVHGGSVSSSFIVLQVGGQTAAGSRD